MWRPEFPEQYADCTWGDLKRLYDRRRAIRSTPSMASESEHREVNQELALSCFAKFGFTEKPLSVWLGGVLGWMPGLSWREEVWYQTIRWEFWQWKSLILDEMGGRQTFSSESIEGLLSVLPAFWLGQDERPDWLEVGAEVEVLWRWTIVTGRRLSVADFVKLAWHVFTGQFRLPIAVVYDLRAK